jgi:hypothetical protein
VWRKSQVSIWKRKIEFSVSQCLFYVFHMEKYFIKKGVQSVLF